MSYHLIQKPWVWEVSLGPCEARKPNPISDESDNENDTNHVVEKQVKEDKEWFLIDSNADHIPIISSDNDLIHYLSNVQGRGALIFRCFVSKNFFVYSIIDFSKNSTKI